MKNAISRNAAAGTVSAQNIQRQPHARFHSILTGSLVSLARSMLTICAASMPNTIVIWLRLTRRPRMLAGDTSAMYMGESADATPMPMPPMKRATLNSVKSSNKPVITALTVNITAAEMSRGFRPYLSAKAPATIAPMRQPTKAVLMATPCITGSLAIWKNSS